MFRRVVAPCFFERNKRVCPVAKIAQKERGTLPGLGSCCDTMSGHFGFERPDAHCNHEFSQSSKTDVKCDLQRFLLMKRPSRGGSNGESCKHSLSYGHLASLLPYKGQRWNTTSFRTTSPTSTSQPISLTWKTDAHGGDASSAETSGESSFRTMFWNVTGARDVETGSSSNK